MSFFGGFACALLEVVRVTWIRGAGLGVLHTLGTPFGKFGIKATFWVALVPRGACSRGGRCGSALLHGAPARQSEEKSSNSSENGVLENGMDDPNPNQTSQKQYQRYSSQQVLRMLEFYEKNTHPDENERQTLGEELGLDPLRVKFWFQNRRSQNKKKDEKTLNKQLREENEKLRIDNGMLKHAIGFPICKNCGRRYTYETSAARVELLRAENAFIKDEIHRVTPLVQKYCGPEAVSCPIHATASSARASGARNGRGSSSPAENDKSAGKKPKRNE